MVATVAVVTEDEAVVKIRHICTWKTQTKNEMAPTRYKLHFIQPKSIRCCVAISPQMKMSKISHLPLLCFYALQAIFRGLIQLSRYLSPGKVVR